MVVQFFYIVGSVEGRRVASARVESNIGRGQILSNSLSLSLYVDPIKRWLNISVSIKGFAVSGRKRRKVNVNDLTGVDSEGWKMGRLFRRSVGFKQVEF